MSRTETYLLLVAFVLFVALVIVIALGRIDAREADTLAKDRDSLAEQLATEQMKVRHLRERNADLRDELDARQPGGRSLTAEWTAFVAELPLTHPEDIR